MRVLILNQAFYPDVVSTAQHATDLGLALRELGHEVDVIASERGYDEPSIRFQRRESWRGIDIHRVGSLAFGKTGKWRRALNFGSFMASCAWRLALTRRCDVVVALTSPPLISFLASLAVPLKAHNLVFWSMDLNPDEAIAAGWLHEKSLVARLLSRMLLHSLRRADRIIALDRFMKDRIRAKGVPHEKIIVVPPWCHDDQVSFDERGRVEFRTRYQLTRKFVVMYSGNHSPCHPLDTLVAAAEQLSYRDDIAFCFVGGGSEFRKVKDRSRDRGMRNVLCLPYQPIEKLSASLSAADLQVVVMGDGFVGVVHPCKIYNILAVGCPFLYIGPPESHLADISSKLNNPALAYFARHGDVNGVVAAILRAMARSEDSHLCGFSDQFSKRIIVPEMINAIELSHTRNGRRSASTS